MWNSTAFSEKHSESRSTSSMQKYQYFEWGSTLNLDGFKIIIFQYIICEPFRSRKEGLVKLNVNLWEIWRKFKCHRSTSAPPPPRINVSTCIVQMKKKKVSMVGNDGNIFKKILHIISSLSHWKLSFVYELSSFCFVCMFVCLFVFSLFLVCFVC